MKVWRSAIAGVLGLAFAGGCVTTSRVDQAPRELPAYDASARLSSRARVTLDADERVKPRLADRLKSIGCELLPSVPTTDARAPERVVELVRCSQETEWSGGTVSLVTVLVIRVRRAGRTEVGKGNMTGMQGARSFQAVSRLSLGNRVFNDERITEAERTSGLEQALDNLMRIRAFGDALEGVR